MKSFYDKPAADVLRAFEQAARTSPQPEPDAPDRYVTPLRYLKGVLLARMAEVKPPARDTVTAAADQYSVLYDRVPLIPGKTYTVRRWVYEPDGNVDPFRGWMVELREVPGLFEYSRFDRK